MDETGTRPCVSPDKIGAAIADNVKDAEQSEKFNETTRKFREMIDGLEVSIRR